MIDYSTPGANAPSTPGAIIRAIADARGKLKESDPRMDILIDIGCLVRGPRGESTTVNVEVDSLRLVRAPLDGGRSYCVYVHDELVYSTSVIGGEITYVTFVAGLWVGVLDRHVRAMRSRRQLSAGASV